MTPTRRQYQFVGVDQTRGGLLHVLRVLRTVLNFPKPGATIEKSLEKLLPPGVFGCCQEKDWMNERGCQLWLEKVWKPYVASHPTSFLMLDEFKCHTQTCFTTALNDVGTDVEIIPGGYTCVLQPCDVGINKPLKDKLRSLYNEWTVDKIGNLAVNDVVPVPNREDVVPWMVEAWASISEKTIRDTFHAIGYGLDAEEQPDQTPPSGEGATHENDEDSGDEEVVELEDLVIRVTL